jgi:hypothetical protein
MSQAGSVSDRLKKGAAILGRLWKDNVRCPEAWSVILEGNDPGKPLDCFCEEKTKFCKGKKQWLDLVGKEKRPVYQGEYGLIETLTGKEFEASGLTVKIDFEGVGIQGIGPGGVMGLSDMVKLCAAPDTLGSILGLMKSFPGMKVEEILPPKEKKEAKVTGQEAW